MFSHVSALPLCSQINPAPTHIKVQQCKILIQNSYSTIENPSFYLFACFSAASDLQLATQNHVLALFLVLSRFPTFS